MESGLAGGGLQGLIMQSVFFQLSAQPSPDETDTAGEESGHAEAGEKEAVGGVGPAKASVGGLDNDLQGQR